MVLRTAVITLTPVKTGSAQRSNVPLPTVASDCGRFRHLSLECRSVYMICMSFLHLL